MPVSTIIVLVGAFAAFASLLAWAQLQTHHLAMSSIATGETSRPRGGHSH